MVKVLEDNYEVSDEDIDERYEELKNQIGEDFESILESRNITEKDLKKDIKVSLLQEAALSEGIEVSEEEIEQYYEKMKYELEASHILVEDERSEEHTSELQSRGHLVCRLLLEKRK